MEHVTLAPELRSNKQLRVRAEVKLGSVLSYKASRPVVLTGVMPDGRGDQQKCKGALFSATL